MALATPDWRLRRTVIFKEALTQERDNLKEEIDLLRKKLFGTSSEKRTLDIPGLLNFFNEAELEQDQKAEKSEYLEALLP
ncbi:MAG: hypothetical protein ACLTAF_18105 [Blautia coccoides]